MTKIIEQDEHTNLYVSLTPNGNLIIDDGERVEVTKQGAAELIKVLQEFLDEK